MLFKACPSDCQSSHLYKASLLFGQAGPITKDWLLTEKTQMELQSFVRVRADADVFANIYISSQFFCFCFSAFIC